MDSIKFEVYEDGPWEVLGGTTAQFARTIINGRSILDIITDCERPLLGESAGGYMEQLADDLYRYMTDRTYCIDGVKGEIGLLICGCLVEGCWPLYVRMDEKKEVITWYDFYNPRISDKPYDIGPFHFARDEFEKAVRELGEQLSS